MTTTDEPRAKPTLVEIRCSQCTIVLARAIAGAGALCRKCGRWSWSASAQVEETGQTVEEFWKETHGDRCCWRTARKAEQRCGHCQGVIRAGERYLDTGEVVGQWATSKACQACAGLPATRRRR